MMIVGARGCGRSTTALRHSLGRSRLDRSATARAAGANPDELLLSRPEPVLVDEWQLVPDVLAAADFVGSTAQMIDYARKRRPTRMLMLTECSMSDNVAVEFPDTQFIRPCNLCPHMKRITLPKIRRALETMTHEVTIDPALMDRARLSVERMLAV